MLTEKSQRIVLEREQGEMPTVIARRHGVSHQRVAAIRRDATAFVNRVELDLMVAAKTGEECAYLIPYGPGYTVAMAYGDWLVKRLRDRGVRLRVRTRRASNGLALLIEDITDYAPGGDE